MTHALVKLSVTSAGHRRVVAAIDLCDVVALDVGYLVHGKIAGKGYLKEGGSRTTRPQWDSDELIKTFTIQSQLFHCKHVFVPLSSIHFRLRLRRSDSVLCQTGH